MAAPGQVGRNVDISGIASYIVVEPPPYCCNQDYGFHPVLTDELKAYGVQEDNFNNLVDAIHEILRRYTKGLPPKSDIYKRFQSSKSSLRDHNDKTLFGVFLGETSFESLGLGGRYFRHIIRDIDHEILARIKFWVWASICVTIIVAGIVTISVIASRYALQIFPFLIAYSGGIIFVGITIGALCRTSTFNDLPKLVSKFDTTEYTWQVRSPPIVCGQLSLKRCVVQVVPRPGFLLERAEAEMKNDHDDIAASSVNDDDACVICFARKINTTLHPCMHKIVCSACAKKIESCPMCRVAIESRVLVELGDHGDSAEESDHEEVEGVELSEMQDESLD